MTSITYRGWTINPCEWINGFDGVGPDYDASWEGEEDGWVDNGQRVWGKDLEDVKNEIDIWFEENAA